uniref:Core shell protein Gag P30 domain-containing protein n=1 Tax=Strix occidentalis caurina TaxID=311401 RepID=A0A8D0FTD4_STROC
MGNTQGGVIKSSPLGCILAHWKDIAGTGNTESKGNLVKYCNPWWPVYKLESEAKWPFNGTLDYNTLLQLMLFLRREGKWDEVSYADMFFTLRNHPEWQRDCGIVPPQDPLVLALEQDNKKEFKGKLKRCCSACSIGQRCTRADKIHRAPEQDLTDLFKPPPRPQEQDEDLDGPSTPPGSPVSSHTRKKSVPIILQAPLREAVGPNGGTMLIKVPFSTTDLEAWKKVARDYRNDPTSVTRYFQFIIKQHNPDWNDIQLLLDHLTETEKQLVLKTAGNLAEDYYKTTGGDVKEYLPLQDPKWEANRSAHMERLQAYQEWIVKGMERAIPKAINWSILYEIKQGPSESPSEFLDRLRDVMRRNTPLDPGSEVGLQQLVSLFLGQSTGDIRHKLQKLRSTESRNLEVLLDEAWRVFRNREEEYKRGQRRVLAVVREEEERKLRRGPPQLRKNQCAICKRFGHWKDECPEKWKVKERGRSNQKGRAVAHMKED